MRRALAAAVLVLIFGTITACTGTQAISRCAPGDHHRSGHPVKCVPDSPTTTSQPSSTAAERPAAGSAPAITTAISTTTAPRAESTVLTTSTTGPAPVLGRAAAYPGGDGFGQVKPQSVFLGGEAESAVTQIAWTSWGSKQAIGTGTGCYYSGSEPAVNCRHEQATLVALDLGACMGTLSYRQLEYVFVEEGESFEPNHAMDICSGP